MRIEAVGAAGALVLSLAAAPPALPAQDSTAVEDTVTATAAEDPRAASVPFGPGERLEYNVKLGIFSVGDAHLTLAGVDSVRGHKTYRARMGIEGGVPFARVDDDFQSWFDVRTLQSWRFVRDVHEVKYKSFRHYEMDPEEGRWWREDVEESGPLGSSLPLDDIAFVYFIRTLPLEVGKTYTLNRYFKEEGNPVVIQVLRRDRRKVPAGEFETIVVKPIIRTRGLFSEGGNAELHFTADERRLLVYLRSEIPVVGSITLHLKTIQEGLPLHPDARAAARARGVAEEGAPTTVAPDSAGAEAGSLRRERP